jgi:hypothetical protein
VGADHCRNPVVSIAASSLAVERAIVVLASVVILLGARYNIIRLRGNLKCRVLTKEVAYSFGKMSAFLMLVGLVLIASATHLASL